MDSYKCIKKPVFQFSYGYLNVQLLTLTKKHLLDNNSVHIIRNTLS